MLGLVADIGSTNARFAVAAVSPRGGITLLDTATYACADLSGLDDGLRRFVERLAQPPRYACVAVAGPVVGDRVALTNHGWEFSIAALQRMFGFEYLSVLNDFVAVSLSLPQLQDSSLAPIGAVVPGAIGDRFAVMGPGTGLGVGALVRADGGWLPIPSEGGHTTFAPQSEAEEAVVRAIAKRYGHVSCERLLSGPGLVNIAEALLGRVGRQSEGLTAAKVTRLALAGSDPVLREALEVFCSALGSVCGDLALTFLADRVFIAGGIVPRILDFVRTSGFRSAFEAKGRFTARMKTVPTAVITHPYPGLVGAAAHLNQQFAQPHLTERS